MTKIQCFVHPPFRSGGCAVGVPEPPSTFWIHPPPAPGRGALRSQVPSPSPRHARHAKQKGESLKILPSALERKTDFRPKHIPRLQSVYYDKHFLEGHSRDAVIMHSFASQCFHKDTNYFHTIQERYSSCFLYAESNVFPSLSFHKVHPFEDRPMQKSEAILGLGKILSEAIVPLRSTGLFRIILFRKAANQVGHLPANLFRTEKFNLLTHPQNPLVEVERRPQEVGED